MSRTMHAKQNLKLNSSSKLREFANFVDFMKRIERKVKLMFRSKDATL